MDAETWLAGVSGTLRGGLDMYSWQKAHQLDEQRLKQQEELTLARMKVQELIAYIQADSRERVATTTSGSRERIANNNVFGQNMRWDRPSGNVLAQQAGETQRAVDAERGRNDRWGRASGNATLGSETARRGQDISASTARRGQDLNYTIDANRNVLTGRGQDLHFQLETEAEAGRTARGRRRSGGLFAPVGETGRDASGATPPAPPRSALPVSPRTPPTPFVPTPAPSSTPAAGRGRGASSVTDEDLVLHARTVLQQNGLAISPENLRTFIAKNRARLEQEILAVRGQNR